MATASSASPSKMIANAYNTLTVLKEIDSHGESASRRPSSSCAARTGGWSKRTGSSRSSSPTPQAALGAISSTVQVGRTSLLAVVTEQSPEVIDAVMPDLGRTVLRRPVADVEAAIAAAEDAARKAKWEARKELARSHRWHKKGCRRREALRDEGQAQPRREGSCVRVRGRPANPV
jgi:hypothetical protein